LSEFEHEYLDIDLGLHDTTKINTADAVVLSPVYGTQILQKALKKRIDLFLTLFQLINQFLQLL